MPDHKQDIQLPAQAAEASAAEETSASFSETGEQLIRRAPTGYLWNQAGAIWLFLSLLIFEVVIRRSLPPNETNTFDLVATIANLGFYIASLGLGSAGTVFIPRALAEGGPALALSLANRLVVLRLVFGLIVSAVIVWGLPAIIRAIEQGGWSQGIDFVHSYTIQAMIDHRFMIAAYVLCVGVSTLLSSLLIALVYTRVVFIIGSLGQLLLLALAYVFVHPLNLGVDGAIAAQALPAAVTAIVFAFALQRVLRSRSSAKGFSMLRPTLKLGIAAWLADLPNASLVQPVALGQLAAVAPTELRYFKSTYQMGDAGARFFTDGLGGISMASMSVSYEGGLGPLAVSWRTVSKLQVLLAAPLVIFCIPHAAAIMRILFGTSYEQSGPLLAVFLALNGLTQLLGGATHEWVLYVLGRQQWVVVSRWATLGILALAGTWLVPQFAALGALLAVGIGRLVAQIFLLVLARIWVRRSYPMAFIFKLLLALAVPVVVTIFWQPAALVHSLVAGADWLPNIARPVIDQGLLLTINLVIFTVILLICLRIVRPLDAEDITLLNQVPRWLRRALLPFASGKHQRAAEAQSSNEPRQTS
jgi:O-antigen/teichoic acid export membrane protein